MRKLERAKPASSDCEVEPLAGERMQPHQNCESVDSLVLWPQSHPLDAATGIRRPLNTSHHLSSGLHLSLSGKYPGRNFPHIIARLEEVFPTFPAGARLLGGVVPTPDFAEIGQRVERSPAISNLT